MPLRGGGLTRRLQRRPTAPAGAGGGGASGAAGRLQPERIEACGWRSLIGQRAEHASIPHNMGWAKPRFVVLHRMLQSINLQKTVGSVAAACSGSGGGYLQTGASAPGPSNHEHMYAALSCLWTSGAGSNRQHACARAQFFWRVARCRPCRPHGWVQRRPATLEHARERATRGLQALYSGVAAGGARRSLLLRTAAPGGAGCSRSSLPPRNG